MPLRLSTIRPRPGRPLKNYLNSPVLSGRPQNALANILDFGNVEAERAEFKLRDVLARLPHMTNWQIPEVNPQA
jgi:hypothetical protein